MHEHQFRKILEERGEHPEEMRTWGVVGEEGREGMAIEMCV